MSVRKINPAPHKTEYTGIGGFFSRAWDDWFSKLYEYLVGHTHGSTVVTPVDPVDPNNPPINPPNSNNAPQIDHFALSNIGIKKHTTLDRRYDADVYVSDFGTLPLALSYIGISNKSLTIDMDCNLGGATIIIGDNADVVQFLNGVKISNGTLTIHKMTADPLHQIFASDVTVSFPVGAVTYTRPEWWGAVPYLGNESPAVLVECGTAINSAINALPISYSATPGIQAAGGGTVLLSMGRYASSKQIILHRNIKIVGQGRASIIEYSGSDLDGSVFMTNDTANIGEGFIGCTGILLKDFSILGNGHDVVGLRLKNCVRTTHIDNVMVHSFGNNGFEQVGCQELLLTNFVLKSNALHANGQCQFYSTNNGVSASTSMTMIGGQISGDSVKPGLLAYPTISGYGGALSDSRIMGTVIESNLIGIKLYGASSVYINCYLENTPLGSDIALYKEPAAHPLTGEIISCESVIIERCTLATYNSIILDGDKDTKVIGCYGNISQSGVQITSNSVRAVLRDNRRVFQQNTDSSFNNYTEVIEHFKGAIDWFRWRPSGLGNVTLRDAENGIVRLSSTASSASYALLQRVGANDLKVTNNFTVEVRARLSSITDINADPIRITSADGNDQIIINATPGTDPKWRVFISKGGAVDTIYLKTLNGSHVAIDAVADTDWHTFRVEGESGRLSFFYDGTPASVSSLTYYSDATYIPTQNMIYTALCQTDTTAAKYMDIDYVQINSDNSSATETDAGVVLDPVVFPVDVGISKAGGVLGFVSPDGTKTNTLSITDSGCMVREFAPCFIYNQTTPPTSPTSTGDKNNLAYDNTYLYVAIDSNNWKRIAWDTSWTLGDLLLETGDYLLLETGDKLITE